ncbi:MAG: hypothetical protein KBC21_03325 [Candidatus Pacebacteria bacterium]|nr:hypothetical protein [Candidatus Paceibacterota bacterium]
MQVFKGLFTKAQLFFTKFLKRKESQVGHIVDGVSSFVDAETIALKRRIESKKRRQKNLKLLLGGLFTLVITFGCIAFYSQYKLRTLTQDELLVDIPKEKQPRTGEEIVKALGRHVVLPEGVPQVAEVQDAARLKTTQAFFENSENGDVVVVYDSRIYLYRPSQDIIVSSGDITGLGQQ